MPYTTNVAGTTITASWANANVRDQVLNPFSSTTARDAAITAPVVGMGVVITSNDSAEGLLVRTSANTWRAPWSMPWGVVGTATVTTAQSGITTIVDMTGFSVTWTAVANRRYLALWKAEITNSVAGDLLEIQPSNAANAAYDRYLIVGPALVAGTGYFTMSGSLLVTGLGAGSQTVKLRALRNAGTGTLTINSTAALPGTLTVIDIGPSGAPA